MSKWITAIAFMLLVTKNTLGANWYVDGNATGSHNGTSWSNAWTSFNQISGVSSGDTVNISGGTNGSSQTYTVSGSFPAVNGVSGSSRTVYQIGQDSSHDGIAVLNFAGNNFLTASIYNVTITGNAADGIRHFAMTNLSAIVDQSSLYASNLWLTYLNFGAVPDGFYYHYLDNVEFDHNYIFKLQSGTAGARDWCFTYQNTAANVSSFGHNRVHDNTIYSPRNGQAGGFGDDCFTSMVGIDIYNNLVIGYYTNYVGSQHQDGVQGSWGAYCRVFNNEFINLANSCIFPESEAGGYDYLQIYNNIMTCDSSSLAGSPMRGVDAISGATTSYSYTHTVIANNLVVDMGTSSSGAAFGIRMGQGVSTYPTCLCANNVLINTYSSYTLNSSVTNWANYGDFEGTSIAGNFLNYTIFGGTNNNFNLSTTSIFRNVGTNLTAYGITADKGGNQRPATGNWDVGPYQYSGGGTPAMQLQFHYGNPLNASNSYSFGSVGTNIATTNTLFTVQNLGTGTLSGTGSVAAPFFIVSGSTYSLAQNQSQPVTVCFKPIAISNYSRTITLSGNGGVVSNLTLSGAGTASTIPASPQMVILAPGP